MSIARTTVYIKTRLQPLFLQCRELSIYDKNQKIKPGNHLVIPYVSVNRQLMLGTGYPLTSQSNTTVCPTEPAKFLGADLTTGAVNEKLVWHTQRMIADYMTIFPYTVCDIIISAQNRLGTFIFCVNII